MLSCYLCLLISCDSLVFWILSFDCSFCLIAWYRYIIYFYAYYFYCFLNIENKKYESITDV